jgi:hypothetical protein
MLFASTSRYWYSEGLKEQALAKVYNRGHDQSIQDVANGLNISLQSLKITAVNEKMGGYAGKVTQYDNWSPL